jgi:hypothetical protein
MALPGMCIYAYSTLRQYMLPADFAAVVHSIQASDSASHNTLSHSVRLRELVSGIGCVSAGGPGDWCHFMVPTLGLLLEFP